MRCLSAFISLISLLALPLPAGEPTPDQLRSLERIAVYPPLVQLFGRDDHRQLVITGWLSDKQPVDLTRTARVVVDPPGVVEVTGSLLSDPPRRTTPTMIAAATATAIPALIS